MIQLKKSVKHWKTDAFKTILKQELEALPTDSLPLCQATQSGGLVDDRQISVLVNSVTSDNSDNMTPILIQIGVFFDEIMGGCSCGDEPHRINSFCEIQVAINKETGATEFTLLT